MWPCGPRRKLLSMTLKRVAIVVYRGIQSLDLAGPFEVSADMVARVRSLSRFAETPKHSARS